MPASEIDPDMLALMGGVIDDAVGTTLTEITAGRQEMAADIDPELMSLLSDRVDETMKEAEAKREEDKTPEEKLLDRFGVAGASLLSYNGLRLQKSGAYHVAQAPKEFCDSGSIKALLVLLQSAFHNKDNGMVAVVIAALGNIATVVNDAPPPEKAVDGGGSRREKREMEKKRKAAAAAAAAQGEGHNSECSRSQGLLMAEGVIGQLVAVLQQVREGQVTAACLAALTNIAWDNADCQEACNQCYAVPSIEEMCLSRSAPQNSMVREWAVSAVEAIENEEQREERRLQKSAFYSDLVTNNKNVKQVVRAMTAKTQHQSAQVLTADEAFFADTQPVGGIGKPESPEAFRARCCADNTVRLLVKLCTDTFEEDTRNALCTCFLSLTAGFDAGREELVAQGGVGAMCKVLACANNQDMIHFLCESLYYLAIEGDGKGAIAAYECDAICLLQGVIDESLDPDTTRWCRRAITSIEKAAG